jgi:glucose/arabinose dehydrogenase
MTRMPPSVLVSRLMRSLEVLGVTAALTLPVTLTACKSSAPAASSTTSSQSSSQSSSSSRPDARAPLPDASSTSDASMAHVPDATSPPRDAPAKLPEANTPDVHRPDAPKSMTNFCALPGSVVWSGGAPQAVAGGPANAPDLTWMKLPNGYCSHYFGTVPETRQLRFSPSGDLFVASPSQAAAGGASGGVGAIVVLPDDNHDGVADSTLTYMANLPITQGLLFANSSLYYQNGTSIYQTPYTNGDRMAGSAGTQVIDVTVYTSTDHWAKVLDIDDNGNIYVTNGGDEGIACNATLTEAERPFQGGILKIDGTPNGTQVAKGLRNVYALRCAKGTGMCFGLELARDFAPELGSREKLIPVRQGDDWGFPCCASANLPYSDYTNPAPDCSGVAAETDSFVIDHTPFALDFEEGFWSGTWQYRAFVGLHGYFGSWIGARVVGIATNAATGWPESAAEADAGTTMEDFATGWDDGKQDHGRPAAIAFSPDGRLFIGNDMNGQIVWVAPVTN